MNTRRFFLTAVLPVVLLLCLRSGAFAQNSQLTGIVTDDNSALIAGAQITLTNVNTSMTHRAVTNADGYYSIPFVLPGNYQLNVVASGFKPVTRNNLSINVAQVARIDFTLEPGIITESVNITSL